MAAATLLHAVLQRVTFDYANRSRQVDSVDFVVECHYIIIWLTLYGVHMNKCRPLTPLATVSQ